MTNYIQMTTRDILVKETLDKLLSGKLTNIKAGELLGLGERQIIRKKQKYKQEGLNGLIHKLRGKKSNHSHNPTKYDEIIKLRNEIYSDYNISHFCEKLEEKHSVKISIPTLRNELIRSGLHKPKKRKVKQEFHYRERKENYGELVQYDGAYHKWLEDRNGGEELCLLVKVDDATGEVNAKFDKSEGIIPTFNFWKENIIKNGKPRAIYLDKFATYKINHPNATNDKELPTQFARTCQTLGISLIFANSPQGKGRVERMNKTLEDRLVKELRENNICDIDSANIFLTEVFLPKFNEKFSINPKQETNLHIPLSKNELEHIDQIFSKHFNRKLKNDFSIAFNNKHYQLYRNKDGGGPHLNKSDTITVEEYLDGSIHLSKNGVYIVFKELPEKRKSGSYKLPMAPANNSHFEEMKSEIDKNQEIDRIREENEKQSQKNNEKDNEKDNEKQNKKSYYEITGKEHPYNKSFKFGKKSPNFVSNPTLEQPQRKT